MIPSAFCPNCGEKTIDGICPRCTHVSAAQDTTDQRFRNFFMNPRENFICALGNTYLQNYLSGGVFSKGFSVISDKRVYFRGSVFVGGANEKLHKVKVSKVVNIRDVTGASVTHVMPIYLLILGGLALLAGLALLFPTGGIGTIIGVLVAALFGAAFYFKRVTLLKIEYAGGEIGFDIKWFSNAECTDYQKQLFLAKDKIFEGTINE